MNIVSNWAKIRIRPRPSRSYQYFGQPQWKQLTSERLDGEQLAGILIPAGAEKYFPIKDWIENAIQSGTYMVKIASDIDGSPIEDPRVSKLIVEILDEPEPTMRVDASNVTIPCAVYFQLIHKVPNENSGQYSSLWSHITVVKITDELSPIQRGRFSI